MRLGKRPVPLQLNLVSVTQHNRKLKLGTHQEKRIKKQQEQILPINPNERNNRTASEIQSIAVSRRQNSATNTSRFQAPEKLVNENNNFSNGPIQKSSENGGCLSPTESPKCLIESLRLAEERERKLREQQKKQETNVREKVGDPNTKEESFEDSEGKIGPYVLLSPLDSAGFCYHALDTRDQTLKTCQILNAAQYLHLLRVTERLDSADTWWKQGETEELREKILPGNADVIKDNRAGTHCLFMPRNYGSVHSYVQSRKRLNESETRHFYAQIVHLVAFCHALGIVVRDLKLRKFVFINEEQTQIGLAGVNDLVVCPDPGNDNLRDRQGCPAYVSPEILDLSTKSYSGRSADVWSLGVLLFVMLAGRYPFYDRTPAGLFGKIRQGSFSFPDDQGGFSVTVKSLIRGLLRRDPAERPSARALLAAPWLKRALQNSAQWRAPENGGDIIMPRLGSSKADARGRNSSDQVVPSL